MRDFHNWADETLEHLCRGHGEAFGLAFALEERPRMGEDEPTIWFAALKQMDVDAGLAPDGVSILSSDGLSKRAALVGLAGWLDAMPDSEREWLLQRRGGPHGAPGAL